MSVAILKKRKNAPKLHFVTFGTNAWEKSKFRLANQAINSQWFSTVNCFSDKDTFLRKHKKSMNGKMAGFGWWKSAIIIEMFKNIPRNDIVLYLDAGFNIIKEKEKKFLTYLEYVLEYGILAFSGQNLDIAEKQFTKRDLLIHLNCDSQHYYSNQYAGGYFFVTNNDFGMKFVQDIYKVYDNMHLANDEPSTLKEYPEFIAHRHDQSILSLIYKLTGLKGMINESETWLLENGPLCPFAADRIADYQMEYLNWPKNAYTLEEIRKLVYKKKIEIQKDERYRL